MENEIDLLQQELKKILKQLQEETGESESFEIEEIGGVNLKELEKAFSGDLDLMLFYLTWIKCGLNASKAYKELHPDCNDHSARVLGSTTLAKIILLKMNKLDRKEKKGDPKEKKEKEK